MTNRYAITNSTASAELAADQGDCRDKKVLQALVTAGALVALADGHLGKVERDELVGFVHRQDFTPTISHAGIAKAFDNRIRELEERYDPNLIIEALRPLADLSLTSVAVRTAERCCRSDNSSRRGAGHQADSVDHDEPAGKRVIARRGLRPSHAIRSIASEIGATLNAVERVADERGC